MRTLSAILLVAVVSALATAGSAQTPPRAATNQPIEITANMLEVKQAENLAVFRGNVDAIQGTLRLKADEIQVRYRQGAGGGNNIERIDAVGNVRFATESESGTGDAGVYDVANQVVVLTGRVQLVRGEDVLQGERLVHNLATKTSTLESKSRVKGLFQPQKKNS